jgi:hypothetical protein
MSGSNDKLADMPPGTDPVSRREPDPVGLRESDPIRAELRERLERLPPGHPSSPYNDDGSRKPPLPDLSDYELPIPGDPDYRPEPSSASEADRSGTAHVTDTGTRESITGLRSQGVAWSSPAGPGGGVEYRSGEGLRVLPRSSDCHSWPGHGCPG